MQCLRSLEPETAWIVMLIISAQSPNFRSRFYYEMVWNVAEPTDLLPRDHVIIKVPFQGEIGLKRKFCPWKDKQS